MTTSRIISWQQLVLEADPEYWQRKNRPMKYEFSNGRRFYDTWPTYIAEWLTDDLGNILTDDQGNPIPIT